MLSILKARVLRFSFIKDLYGDDLDFKPIILGLQDPQSSRLPSRAPYVLHKEFLFNNGKLCVPKGSIRDLFIREAHSGGLAGHFGVNKTCEVLN